MPIPMRPRPGIETEPPVATREPSLVAALVPVVGPVILISLNTIVDALRTWDPSRAALWTSFRSVTGIIGNPNFAMLLAAVFAMGLYARQRDVKSTKLASMVENSLMGAGVVILIVAAGGAFGAMLQAAQLGPAIQALFVDGSRSSGFIFLILAFSITVVFKIAQGSSTVAMITAAGMMAAMVKGLPLPYHMVYLGTAISAGSLVGSWMNDAGFWVFSKIGGVTEVETLKSWSPLSAIVGVTSMVVTLILAFVLPLTK